MENYPNNIRKIRKAKKLTLEEVAERAKASVPQVQKLEKGERRLTVDWAQRLAKALETTAAEIMGIEVGISSALIPIVARVGAGAAVFSYDDHAKGAGLDMVECPPNMNPKKTVALEVVGDSMEPLMSEGFLLFYEDRIFGVPDEHLGKICVVQVHDGPILVKRIRKGSKVGLYDLQCLNPLHDGIRDAVVEWSALVRYMEQK